MGRKWMWKQNRTAAEVSISKKTDGNTQDKTTELLD
jgi:hypothetical protein